MIERNWANKKYDTRYDSNPILRFIAPNKYYIYVCVSGYVNEKKNENVWILSAIPPKSS